MWQLQPLTVLLLLVSAGLQDADLPKAVVFLDPPWDRVLTEDNVTLRCRETHPSGDSSTQWLFNGSLMSNQESSYFIPAARAENSGEYRCQTNLSSLSDPVHLKVHSDWLVLQSHRWVYQEGDHIQLRCHTWKNLPLYKVTYLQDGKGMKFFHQNTDFNISKAAHNHSGSYFCRGLIGRNNVSSESVNILVQAPAVPTVPTTSQFFPPWHQIAFCLIMGLLFAVDTGLYFSMQREFQSSVGGLKNHQIKWSRDLQDK